jgi:hypothetical protein
MLSVKNDHYGHKDKQPDLGSAALIDFLGEY